VAGARLMHPVEANEVFVALPEKRVAALETQFKFYRWPLDTRGEGVPIRLVTTFATTAGEVDEFISAANR
jgi:threonine aldolase